VNTITTDDLKAITETFYHPSALSLTIVGDFDEAAILSLLARILPEKRQTIPTVESVKEPEHPIVFQSELRMDVATSSFLIGIKDPVPTSERPLHGRDLAIRQRSGRLIFDTLLSEASAIHEELFDAGLIHDSFGVQYVCESDFAFAAAGGESDQPAEAAQRLIDLLVQKWNEGLDPYLFSVQKKAAAGDFLRSFDSIDHSGMVQARCNLYPVDLFDFPAIYDKIELTALRESFAFIGDPNNYSLIILNPIGGVDPHAN
jgi:predicted Zn-dependent peptidase